MKNRLISFLVAITLIFNIFAFSTVAKDEKIEVYRLMTGVSDGNGAFYNDYYVDSNGNVADLFGEADDIVVCAAEDTLPTEYSSVDLGIITAPKNQAGSSSCWAFSTISALETSSIMQGFDTLETADYSEAHLSWFGQNELTTDIEDGTYGDGRNAASPYLTGGNWLYSTSALARGSGLQKEENAPWIASYNESVLNTMNYPESERYVSYMRLKGSHKISDTSRDGIKKAIMEHGSLMASIYSDFGYFTSNYAQYHQTAVSDKTNHAITLVGWDDNYSKDKFNSKCLPKNNGAWLCKNSWGTSLGEKGYFWLSYEEVSLTTLVYFEAMKDDEFDKIYQYDGSQMKYLFSSISGASVANTFTADDDELLTHVGFFSPNTLADATVRIYKGESDSEKNPTSGTVLVEEATTAFSDIEYGYQNVKLNLPVSLSKGETFTVAVSLKAESGTTYIATEGETLEGVPATEKNYAGNKGESFACVNGSWYDTSEFISGKDYNNVCVKAMTVKTERLPGDANDDGIVNLKDVVFIRRFLADGFDVTIKEINCDVDADGVITLIDVVILTRFLAGGYDITLI